MRATIQMNTNQRGRAAETSIDRWHGIRGWDQPVKAAVVASAATKVRSLPAIHRETFKMMVEGERVTPLAARSAVYALLAAAATRAGQSRARRVLVEQAMVLAQWVEEEASKG